MKPIIVDDIDGELWEEICDALEEKYASLRDGKFNWEFYKAHKKALSGTLEELAHILGQEFYDSVMERLK